MGSFEEWSYRIRCPLLWLDRIDPCDSIKTIRENDPLRSLTECGPDPMETGARNLGFLHRSTGHRQGGPS